MKQPRSLLLSVICLLLAGGVWAQTNSVKKNFAAIAARVRPAQALSPAVAAAVIVPPQPAPTAPQSPTAAISNALKASNLDLSKIAADKVVALSDGHAEQVTSASLVGQVDRKTVLVERTQPVARSIELSAALQSRLPSSALIAKPTQGLELGYRVLAYESGPDKKPVQLNPFLIDTRGLLLDAAAHGYVGTVMLALLSESDRDSSGDLDAPVSVLVTAKGADAIDPQLVKFVRYGPGDPQTVTIRVGNPPTDAFAIGASADFGATYNYAQLAVSRPQIQIVPREPEIPGLGIGVTTLDIQLSDLQSPEQFPILFKGDTTGLSENPARVDKDGIGHVQWRSHGIGKSTLTIAAAGLSVDPIEVTFVAPWEFLLCAAGGGLVGAFLRGKGRERWPMALLIGVISALLMVVAYSLGFVDWIKSVSGGATPPVTGEAIIVVLGAIAALLGVTALVPAPKSPYK